MTKYHMIAVGGPVILLTPYPRPENDVLAGNHWEPWVGPTVHVVPKIDPVTRKRPFRTRWTPETADNFVLVTPEELHAERSTTAGCPAKVPLALAARLKARYWAGELSLRDVSAGAGWSRVCTAHHLVTGRTYWYA